MKSTVFTCVFAGFLTALATGRCLADSFTFTTIDNPLAQPGNTWVYGISGNTVVGTYFDNLGQYHGFTEANGVFTTLTPPVRHSAIWLTPLASAETMSSDIIGIIAT